MTGGQMVWELERKLVLYCQCGCWTGPLPWRVLVGLQKRALCSSSQVPSLGCLKNKIASTGGLNYLYPEGGCIQS